MLAVTHHAMGHGFPWTRPADQWCIDTAARMAAEGYSVGAIIAHLTAYGCGLFAAQKIAGQYAKRETDAEREAREAHNRRTFPNLRA